MANKQRDSVLMKSIDVFLWTEHFNTGIPKIDEQHQRLVQLLNRLASHIAFHSDIETLDTIFHELSDYAVYHFQSEEAVWREYLNDIDSEAKHKAEHDNFVSTVLDLKAQKNKENVDTVIGQAFSFLVNWLASHILENDKYMALVALAIQSGSSLEQAKNEAKEKLHGELSILLNLTLSTYNSFAINAIRLMEESLERKLAEKKLRIYAEQLKKSLQELESLNQDLEKQYIDSIKAFSRIIEMRPGIKGGQSKYIAEQSLLIAQLMDLEPEDKKNIFYAGLLIQIGKISLPDKLLFSAFYKLSIGEKQQFLHHAVEGEMLLNGLTPLKKASKLIRHQYEFYDGSGFPDGLLGESIPLGSRILAVVRDYIAYLDGSKTGEELSVNATIKQLLALKGKYYDPDIVDIFFRMLNVDAIEEEVNADSFHIVKSWKTSKLMSPSNNAALERPVIEASIVQLKPGMEIESVYFDNKPFLRNCILDQKIIDNIRLRKENSGQIPIIKIRMGKK
ncbi:MAG: bacteriohemerythrin [Methylobacter sp.]